MTTPRLGIDLGGTKTEAVVLDDDGSVLFRHRVDTPTTGYAAILTSISDLVERAEAEVGQSLKVGMGTPGALSPATGLLRNSNTVCLNGQPLLQDLQRMLQRPVRIANDANCFALSEAMDAAAADAQLVFGVIIGTGTGGGVVWNKQLLTGPHAIAGEWGHNPLPWVQDFDRLRPCYCGKYGCIETFLSGPGMAGNTQALTGLDLTSREIVARARAGDATCGQQMQHYYDQMARALAHVINILDPAVIVLGGGMSNIESLYRTLPQRLPEYVFSDCLRTLILPARRGDASGVYGAALLWE